MNYEGYIPDLGTTNPTFLTIPTDDQKYLRAFDTEVIGHTIGSDFFIKMALRAYDCDDPTKIDIQNGARMLLQTGRIVNQTNLNTPAVESFSLSLKQKDTFIDGIFEATFATKINGSDVRLFELGFFADEEGDLVIKQVQKHRLGSNFRKNGHRKTEHLFNEKKDGDIYWRTLTKTSGYPPELYGFFIGALLLGPHANNGMIIFPETEYQDEIQKRRALIQVRHDDDSPEQQEITKLLYKDIEAIAARTDFYSMLTAIGVPVERHKEGYMHTSLNSLLQAVQYHWTDDENSFRYPYRKTLYSIYNMQM